MTAFLVNGPEDAPVRLVLAHGAGAPMDSGFMDAFAAGLGDRGLGVVRFEFPYMNARRETGSRRPPDREAVLLNTWRDVVAELGGHVAIGGKSMGGRMASMVAESVAARALVCLGYPFHAPGRPDKPRVAHLRDLAVPTLIVQGTRDPFGGRDDVAGYELSDAIRVHWVEDGDHDLTPRKAAGSRDAAWAAAMDAVAAFLWEQA